MKPLTKLKETQLPDGGILELWERDDVYSLLLDGQQMASSFFHGSDLALAEISLAPLKRANQPQILIDGLGLGFVLASAMQEVPKEKASFVVAEPATSLVEWFDSDLSALHPGILKDPRVVIEPQTMLAVARRSPKKFHAVLMKGTHGRLRLNVGEASDISASMKEGGLLVISLPRADKRMEKHLQRAGFQVTTQATPVSHKGKQSSYHILIIAKKGRYIPMGERQRS